MLEAVAGAAAPVGGGASAGVGSALGLGVVGLGVAGLGAEELAAGVGVGVGAVVEGAGVELEQAALVARITAVPSSARMGVRIVMTVFRSLCRSRPLVR